MSRGRPTDSTAGTAGAGRAAAPLVAIFTDEVGWHTRRLQAALRARGALGRCLDLAHCAIDSDAPHGLRLPGLGGRLPDAAIVRGIAGGTLEQITKRLGVLHLLRELGVGVANDARAIERSVDKSMTAALLAAAGVPTPPAWTTESAHDARRLVEREAAAGRSLVLKPLFGSQGRGLVRVGCVDGAFVPLPPIGGHPGGAAGDAGGPAGADFGGVAHLQRFVPPPAGSVGHDWRVFVVGGRAIAAMRRRAPGGWIHNVAQGGRCAPQPLRAPGDAASRRLAEIAEAAAAALAMDHAGVDLVPATTAGADPLVVEVNGVAAWRGLQRVAPVDVAAALVDDLLGRLRPMAALRRCA